MNIFILDKNYNQIGMLSNEGANPQAPYFDDLYTQELDTGADIFEFTTLSTSASRDFIEIGNHVLFQFNNRHRLFAISTLELEHKDGMNVIHVYAEGVGFQLLETFLGTFEGEEEDKDGDGEPDKIVGGEIHTYETFLQKVLKDTDWNYQIVSGDLVNIEQGVEVTFPDGKNIYALLQDSMQTFGGVELEFRAEYSGGSLSKTIYAYAHKGRGSFVGQRFEYGINVKGIKKTQEIVDQMDENIIIYDSLVTVDGLNTEVTYEVDFALRSYEVEDLEIGDTHYIIDNDFDPPQFEARIGKIEISFSDPTKNKCYLANFKKITGSKPDEPDGENVEDMIEDKLEDNLNEIEDLIDEKIEEVLDDLGELKEHTHDRLVCTYEDTGSHSLVYSYGAAIEVGGENDEYHVSQLSADNMSFNFGGTNETGNWASIYIRRFDSFASGTPSENIAKIYTNLGDLMPYYNDTQYIGSLYENRWEHGYINHMHAHTYNSYFGRNEMKNVSEITDSSSVSKQDLLDFILNDVNIYQYLPETTNELEPREDNYLGVLSEDFEGSEVGSLIMNDHERSNDIDYYNVPSLVTALIGAFQQHVENGGGEEGGDIDLSAYATKAYVNDIIDDIEMPDLTDYATKEFVNNAIKAIEMEVGKTIIDIEIDDNNHLIFTFSDSSTIDAGVLPSGGNDGGGSLDSYIDAIEVDNIYTDTGKDIDLHVRKPTYFDGPIYMTGEWNTWGGASNSFTSIYGVGQIEAMIVNCDLWRPYDVLANITFDGSIVVNGIIFHNGLVNNSDISKKENIRYINNQAVQKENLKTRNYSNEDLLEKADLHDFIVNQVNICEYNFIGDTANKIGFIANDYEGTKVGDKIVSKQKFKERNDDGEVVDTYESLVYDPNNLLFATIGALQEEVRVKDEKIASLEARLAKIEEMLGINN